MRVLFILPGLGGGGAEVNAVRLSRPLMAEGLKCTYACISHQQDYRDQLADDAELLWLVRKPSRWGLVRVAQAILPLARLLRQRRFDVLVPVLDRPTLATLLARAAARRRSPVVMSLQNARLKFLREDGALRARLAYTFWTVAYARLDGVIALSEGVARDLRKAVLGLATRTRTVHNVGVPNTGSTRYRDVYQRNDGGVRLVACGRLVAVKDYPTLLRAVGIVAQDHDVRLEILGSGPLQAQLEAFCSQLGIADRVMFRGFVDRPASIIREADIFVLSSVSEGFGNVIIEAMAEGVPVVATDCPYGPGEIIHHELNGLLVPVSDPKAMAMAIERLVVDAGLRNRLSRAGRKRSCDFTPDRIGRAFARALNELIEATGDIGNPSVPPNIEPPA